MLIKDNSFNPCPVHGKPPIWANSEKNPRCVGTKNHQEYWDEQFYYCENGYTTGGVFLPGRYYHFLNFVPITGLQGKGYSYPYYLDDHLDIFLEIEDCISNHHGEVVIKARRKALSTINVGVFAYGLRFIPVFRGAVCAGLDIYTQGFRRKLIDALTRCPGDMRLNFLLNNEKILNIGYEEKIGNQFIEQGCGASVQFATFKDDATKLEGEAFHWVLFEEAGLFPLLKEAYMSIKPALEFGDVLYGVPWIQGTGGKVLTKAKQFKEMLMSPEAYQLKKTFVSGTKMYFPCFGGAKNPLDNKDCSDIPNLTAQGYTNKQLVGCGDEKRSLELIMNKRLVLQKQGDKKALRNWIQKYPISEEEALTSSGSNNFNNDLLYDTLYKLESLESRGYRKYVLDFEKNSDGLLLTPLRVTRRNATDKDPDWKCVLMYKDPLIQFRDLDVIGIDGYNEDETDHSNSLGAIIVVRRYDVMPEVPQKEFNGRIPVCLYYDRPPRKEQFWEMCAKLSVYYNTIKNTMIAAESDAIIQYFKDNGLRKYLSPRPKTFDAPDSKVHFEFGAKMNNYSKPRMMSLLQTWVEDDSIHCPFPKLLEDLIAYDEENIGTDWDSVDALGLSLMRIIDMKRKPKDEEQEKKKEDQYSFDLWPSGSSVPRSANPNNFPSGPVEKKSYEDLPDPFMGPKRG